VKAIETAGDEITRELITLLNTQYVTPFDREDIYELADQLDDVVDYIEEVSDLLELYGIESDDEARRGAVQHPRAGGRAALDRLDAAQGPARHPAAARRAEAAGGRG
jgi:hypothetical protein